MLKRIGLLAVVLASVTALSVMAQQGAVRSGPQVGEDVPGPFHPLNITGENAGRKACLYCQHGESPVAVVFAREVTPAVAALLKKLDMATEKNKGHEMGSYAVFCTDDEKVADQLKEVATKQNLKHITLAIDNPGGPKAYKVAKDADVTVVLYLEHSVKANHAFKKGDLNEAAITKVVADVSKIIPKK